ncbi:MAG: hypothetical protein R2909_17600 [Gemmatimonadales bacterium]
MLRREPPPDRVKVTANGYPKPLILRAPVLADDSLRGWYRPDSLALSTSPDATRLISLALSDVRSVRTRRVDLTKTITLVGVLGIGVAMAAAMEDFSGGIGVRIPCGLLGEPCR